MRIRWDPIAVETAAETLEKHIAKIQKPLEQALKAAEKARKTDNLPQYVTWKFDQIVEEIKRTITHTGEGHVYEEGVGYVKKNKTWPGRLQYLIDDLRKLIPEDALAKAKKIKAETLPLVDRK